jgi:two-component system KDP operon response regulator KdpE
VLVVDDEPQIRRMLQVVLTNHGYQVRTAADGEAALTQVTDWRPALVITDLSMRRMGGVELCQRIRAQSPVPIIVMSVDGEEGTKVAALDAGADDYVTKPFGTGELLARVRAKLRRTGCDVELGTFEAGDFSVDVGAGRVTVRGTAVRLTPMEFELFVYMARRPNRVLGHRTLLEAVWGQRGELAYLRVFILHLRQKLERDPSEPRYLQSEPWVGYSFKPYG